MIEWIITGIVAKECKEPKILIIPFALSVMKFIYRASHPAVVEVADISDKDSEHELEEPIIETPELKIDDSGVVENKTE